MTAWTRSSKFISNTPNILLEAQGLFRPSSSEMELYESSAGFCVWWTLADFESKSVTCEIAVLFGTSRPKQLLPLWCFLLLLLLVLVPQVAAAHSHTSLWLGVFFVLVAPDLSGLWFAGLDIENLMFHRKTVKHTEVKAWGELKQTNIHLRPPVWNGWRFLGGNGDIKWLCFILQHSLWDFVASPSWTCQWIPVACGHKPGYLFLAWFIWEHRCFRSDLFWPLVPFVFICSWWSPTHTFCLFDPFVLLICCVHVSRHTSVWLCSPLTPEVKKASNIIVDAKMVENTICESGVFHLHFFLRPSGRFSNTSPDCRAPGSNGTSAIAALSKLECRASLMPH